MCETKIDTPCCCETCIEVPSGYYWVIGYGLKYENTSLDLHGYSDCDWAGSVTGSKSTSGCCFNLGSAMISWICRKQYLVAQSSTDTKYNGSKRSNVASKTTCEFIQGVFEAYHHSL